MVLQKDRSQIYCYWESQPGGCRKPHCAFKHQNKTTESANSELEPSCIKPHHSAHTLSLWNNILSTSKCILNVVFFYAVPDPVLTSTPDPPPSGAQEPKLAPNTKIDPIVFNPFDEGSSSRRIFVFYI